ncbi:hypothetical protein MKX54_10945 [Alkalihalobacillus sp. FSL R5-0424]
MIEVTIEQSLENNDFVVTGIEVDFPYAPEQDRVENIIEEKSFVGMSVPGYKDVKEYFSLQFKIPVKFINLDVIKLV